MNSVQPAGTALLAARTPSDVHALALQFGVEDYVIEDAALACRAVVAATPWWSPAQALRHFVIPDGVWAAGRSTHATLSELRAA